MKGFLQNFISDRDSFNSKEAFHKIMAIYVKIRGIVLQARNIWGIRLKWKFLKR